MIRYALIAVGVVVVYLWYQSRQAALYRGTAYQAQPPSPWAALGQLIGGAFAGSATRSQPTPSSVKPSADGVYSRLGNQSPVTSMNYQSPWGSTPYQTIGGGVGARDDELSEEQMAALQDKMRG